MKHQNFIAALESYKNSFLHMNLKTEVLQKKKVDLFLELPLEFM